MLKTAIIGKFKCVDPGSEVENLVISKIYCIFVVPIQKQYAMVLVNSAEFATHQDKYFNLALNEQVFVKKGENTFIVTKVPEKKLLKPDADFHRAISMEEFQRRMHVSIRKFFADKQSKQ